MSLYCKSAGMARPCGDCRHNPANQMGEAKGQPIAPTIRKDLKCRQWQSVPYTAKAKA